MRKISILLLCFGPLLLSSLTTLADIRYDKEKQAIILSEREYRLKDIADSIDNPLIFFWENTKNKAICSANLYIENSGKLTIGKSSKSDLPWEKDWQPVETLLMRSLGSKTPYGIVVKNDGVLEIVRAKIYSVPENLKIRAIGRISISFSLVIGDVFLDFAKKQPVPKSIKNSLINGAITPRGRKIIVEGCQIDNHHGIGINFWSSLHKDKVIKSCLINGKSSDVNISHALGTLTDCHFNPQKVTIKGYTDSKGKDYPTCLSIKQSFDVQVLDSENKPIEGLVIKSINQTGKKKKDFTSYPTSAQGMTRLVFIVSEIFMDGKKGEKFHNSYKNFIKIGANNSVVPIQLKNIKNRLITIVKENNTFKYKRKQ